MSMDTLIQRIVQTQNPTVVGLDPMLEYIPEHIVSEAFAKAGEGLAGAAEAVWRFNTEIIDAICDIVPAVKPQAAYYERLGWQGVRILYETIAYAHKKGMYVITDGKRNDIGSTMEAYAAAHLGRVKLGQKECEPFGADALTVNGYLGSDGIKPLLAICREYDKGIFVLVKTSNPSSGELQDRLIDTKPVYEVMGGMCEAWGQEVMGRHGYSDVGAVVGATYPDQLRALREKLPHTFFLVPGYGAQGGGAADVAGAFDRRGLGAVINNSRGIITAWKKTPDGVRDHAKAARQAALAMKEDILSYLGSIAL